MENTYSKDRRKMKRWASKIIGMCQDFMIPEAKCDEIVSHTIEMCGMDNGICYEFAWNMMRREIGLHC